MSRIACWVLAGCALATAPGRAAAQRDSAATRMLLRAHLGFLNQDDPLDFELAGGADVGADFGGRWALVGRVVAQGEVANPGRSGPVPTHRVVLALAAEYAPDRVGRYGEQFRIRLSAGAMVRQGLATAPVVAPGLLFRYGPKGGNVGVVFSVEDVLAFLPTEFVSVDAKVEHNFGGSVGLEIRL